MANTGKTFVVEHLDGELGPWSELEYVAIANETRDAKSTFVLSGLPHQLQLPLSLTQNPAFKAEGRAVEELYAAQFPSICLLDPSASQDLSPEDGDKFDIFLFGGILGDDPPRDALESIAYVDFPELKWNLHESTEMPFRYVADGKGEPIMPQGMRELIQKDADKSVDDLF